ncbi:MAG: transglutaminase family protein [Pirellulaceae bacterium]
MRYKITHRTTYTYSEPVPVCHNQVLLTPRDDPHQRCRWHSLLIRPKPAHTLRRRDNYGNHVHAFSIETNHRKLEVTASSRVQVAPRTPPDSVTSRPWEEVVRSVRQQTAADWLEACQFVFDSQAIQAREELAQYAAQSFTPARPIVEAVIDFTGRIKNEFKYDTKATHVGTTTEEAFRLRRGVCQDFAHVQIACLRSLGVPARYVSGYLRTVPPPGKPRLVGADQSHAWASVYCGESLWLDVDPTNAVVCSNDHVTLAWGRDYTDVCPIKGTFLGGGAHTLHVSVDVAPLDEA